MKFKIQLIPYPRYLTVVYDTYENGYKFFKTKGIILGDNINASAIMYNTNYYIFLKKDSFTQPILAHELIHISWFLNKDVGVDYSYACDEHQAYFVSHYMQVINNKIK